ncbi:MAG TPA: tetratricopeptide repeat protein [Candidatus Polarisedimenticolaceae bacterium]|nr:tetratricopeptide repeat protein [Candidatus Polarisedimenticolaceae bacterium]
MSGLTGTRRSIGFAPSLVVILLIGAVLRAGYTIAQARSDPWFALPMLDGRYYVEWAASLAAGRGGPPGAFYLAPLYPYLLALLIRLGGLSFLGLYVVQQAMGLASAAILAVGGRRVLGETAALATALLFVLHHPLQFFAARPLGEALAILLLTAALALVWRTGPRAGLAAGVCLGLAALTRPNLLLVLPAWVVVESRDRRWRRLATLVLGFAVVVAPVTLRNRIVSGHWVAISSNGGLTAYHGNGPGARGVYTHPAGFPFEMHQQREAATRRARQLSGLALDPVEADAWWGRKALEARLARPLDTAGLVAWRVALTLDNRELSLDYPPMLDPNPWRTTLRLPPGHELAWVPWALLVGLAGAGAVGAGWRRSGGAHAWGALIAALATPVLFYVSSRYRLPAAALLAVPAGAGVAVLLERSVGARRWRALAMAVALIALSMLVPSAALERTQRAEGLGNRAAAYLACGQLERAEADATRAVELEPDAPRLWATLGAVMDRRERFAAAEQAYERALALEPIPEAAAGLAAALAAQGRVDRGVAVLRRALVLAPGNAACWNGLVGLLYASGDLAAARRTAREAVAAGVELDGELRSLAEGGAEDGS